MAAPLHDRMTQCIYTKENLPRQSFNEGLPRDLEPWFVVPLQLEGMAAMERVNKKLGNILLIVAIYNSSHSLHYSKEYYTFSTITTIELIRIRLNQYIF